MERVLPEIETGTRSTLEEAVLTPIQDLMSLTRITRPNRLKLMVVNNFAANAEFAPFYAPSGYDGGVIYFRKGYLLELAADMDSGSSTHREKAKLQLVCDTVHELYHLREAKMFPHRWDKTCPSEEEVKSLNNLEILSRDRAEIAAEMFACRYLEEKFSQEHSETLKGFLAEQKRDIAACWSIRRAQEY